MCSSDLTPVPGPTPTPSPTPTPAAAPAVVLARNLELTKEEMDFMEDLGMYAGGSPRRALRFLNVYQVVKASTTRAKSPPNLLQGGFPPLMTQIAIVTGAPALLEEWRKWLEPIGDSEGIAQVLAKVSNEEWLERSEQGRNLTGALTVLSTKCPAATAGELKGSVGLARRYSFTG